MHTKRASTAQSTFFAHHEEEFNLHIGYELVRDRRDDAFLVSGPVGLFKIKWGLPNRALPPLLHLVFNGVLLTHFLQSI